MHRPARSVGIYDDELSRCHRLPYRLNWVMIGSEILWGEG